MALLVIGVLAERLVARVAVMFLEIVDDTSRKIVGDRRIKDDARVAIRIIAYFAMRDDFKVLGGISRQRSEERRVGKECVSTCRSRWWQYNYKKHNKENQKIQKK